MAYAPESGSEQGKVIHEGQVLTVDRARSLAEDLIGAANDAAGYHTKVDDLSADAYLPTTLALEFRPGEWEGTFTLVLKALVDDLLSDGTPFKATLYTVEPNNTRRVITGYVDDHDDDAIDLLDKFQVPFETIYRIEVS